MADRFDPNGKASFLSASVSDKRERERERDVEADGDATRLSIRDECKYYYNVKTRGTEEREKGWERKGWRRTTRFTTMQLDRAFTSFPF